MEEENKEFLSEWNGSDKVKKEVKENKKCKCEECACDKKELLNE